MKKFILIFLLSVQVYSVLAQTNVMIKEAEDEWKAWLPAMDEKEFRSLSTIYQVKSITLPGRVMLEYVEQGDAAGIPVIFLHGLTDSWHSFELVLPHLPSSVHA